jgi:hypothetical protein
MIAASGNTGLRRCSRRRFAITLTLALFLSPGVAFAQTKPVTADEILDRALEAMGGKSAIDGVQTLVVSSDTTRFGPGGTIKVPTTTYFQFPLDVRHEARLNGKSIALVSTTSGAVMVTPEGNIDLPPGARTSIESPAMRNPVALLKARRAAQVSFEFRGADRIGDSVVDLLEMKVGPHLTMLAIDRTSGQILRQSYSSVPGDDVRGNIVITFFDYTKVESGLVYPFASRAEVDGKVQSEARVTQLRVNERLDPELFPAPLSAPRESQPQPPR